MPQQQTTTTEALIAEEAALSEHERQHLYKVMNLIDHGSRDYCYIREEGVYGRPDYAVVFYLDDVPDDDPVLGPLRLVTADEIATMKRMSRYSTEVNSGWSNDSHAVRARIPGWALYKLMVRRKLLKFLADFRRSRQDDYRRSPSIRPADIGVSPHTFGDVASELRQEGFISDDSTDLAPFGYYCYYITDKGLAVLGVTSTSPSIWQQSTTDLIAAGESDQVEFKIAALLNPRSGHPEGNMIQPVIKTVTCLLNSAGGVLLIGVEDNSQVVGVEREYAAVNQQKQNRDGYQLWLGGKLRATFGDARAEVIRLKIEEVHSHDVCRIEVPAYDEPTYTPDGDFYRRSQVECVKLNTQQAHGYIHHQWPNSK